jgi:predicted kinase
MVGQRERGLRDETLAAAPERRLPGREHAAVYLITGVPGAGKSTVARLLALHFDRAAHIDIDLIYHHFTVVGLEQPAAQTGQADRQADLAVGNAASMARNYVMAGYVCVLDGAIATRSQVAACQRAVAPHPLHLVVLAPPAEVSDQRDAQRSGKHVAEHFRHLHPLLHSELAGLGLRMDNSQQSPLGTARMILAHRADARLSPPDALSQPGPLGQPGALDQPGALGQPGGLSQRVG